MKESSERGRKLLRQQKFFSSIRDWMTAHGFLEFNTPLLVLNPGLDPNIRHLSVELHSQMEKLPKKAHLISSPEYHLKKILSEGFEKIFEITRAFRNGEKSTWHRPEFWIMEWYRSPGKLREISDDLESLIAELCQLEMAESVHQKPLPRNDFDLAQDFQDLWKIPLAKLLGEDPSGRSAFEAFSKLNDPDLKELDNFSDCFNLLLDRDLQPTLPKRELNFLWNFPLCESGLCRESTEAPGFAQRFELFWGQHEIANAFGEITDSREQRIRCQEDQEKRQNLYGESPELDEEFLNSLDRLPDSVAGIAVGLDRLLALLCGEKDLMSVSPFDPLSPRED